MNILYSLHTMDRHVMKAICRRKFELWLAGRSAGLESQYTFNISFGLHLGNKFLR